MPEVNLSKLKKLFQEKKYSEIVMDVELKTKEHDRSPALHNLLGVCRASQKGRSDRDVKYALKDFETAFSKDNLGEISLDSLCNHIKLCAEMGRRESDLVNNMLTSEKMYIKAKKKFSNNERFIGTGLDIYKYLLKHEKRILNLEKIISITKLNKLFGTIYITSQMYLNNWSQKDFGDFQFAPFIFCVIGMGYNFFINGNWM